MLPHPTLPLVYGVAQEYLRTPVGPVISVNEEETGGAQATTAAPVVEQPGKPVQPPASNAAPAETGVKETTALPPIHAAPDVLATAPSNASVDVTPLRAEMDTIQTRKAAVVQSAKQQRSMLSNALWISGAAASVGAIAWIAHATGLMRRLLALAPAWRRGGAVPILPPDEDERRRTATNAIVAPPPPSKAPRKSSE